MNIVGTVIAVLFIITATNFLFKKFPISSTTSKFVIKLSPEIFTFGGDFSCSVNEIFFTSL